MISLNVHPNVKWGEVNIEVWGPGEGSCLKLVLRDTSSSYNVVDFAIHYGAEGNRKEFITKFKAAVAKLPEEEGNGGCS